MQRLKVVNTLLTKRADVNATSAAGWTPLMFAAFYGQEEIVNRLLEVKSDPNCMDIKGRGAASWLRFAGLEPEKVYSIMKALQDNGLRSPHSEPCEIFSPLVLPPRLRALLPVPSTKGPRISRITANA